MARERRTATNIISAAIFILMEIAALAMLRSSSTLQNIWINRSSHRVIGFLWSGSENIKHHFSLQKENDRLREENFRLSERLRAYDMSRESFRESDALVEGPEGFTYIPATVVKISRNTAHNYIILNKGSEDGVKPHSGIITEKGVVGIISAVDRHYSYGLTLMNSNISISSRAGKDGVAAQLVWDGKHSNKAVLKDVPLHFDIAPGDTVFTSGFSNIFPKDIPVGDAGETTLVDGSKSRIEVTLFQDFTSLRYVTIVYNPERDILSGFEKKEDNR